ncbi:MAG: protein translocase subunit SecD, partial [Bacteroidota bacterium]
MKNKSTVIFLLLVFVAICGYNLFWTQRQFSMESERNAQEEAYALLDSVAANWSAADSVVAKDYDDFKADTVFTKTYKKAVDNSFTLGLDLQGGMFVTLEVGVEGILRNLGGNSKDAQFDQALKCATEKQSQEAQAYVPLFLECWNQIAPERRLGAIFANSDRGISSKNTNEEVATILAGEADAAIDNTFKVIRARIDQFGVASPTLQKQASTGRILIELPGVKDPERVRKLLRATAELEFFETHPWQTAYPVLGEINEYLRRVQGLVDTTATDSTNAEIAADEQAGDAETAGDTSAIAANDSSAQDSTTGLDALTNNDSTELSEEERKKQFEEFKRENPLWAVLNQVNINVLQQQQSLTPLVGYVSINDTAKLNKIFKMEEVQELIDNDMQFAWGFKPISNGTFVELICLKVDQDGGPAMKGDMVATARGDRDQQKGNEPYVSMNMTSQGAKRWGQITKNNVKRHVAIVLDGAVYSYPRVIQAITGGQSSITGQFTKEEADDLANILKAGKLPAPAKIAGEETVGPTLGEENVQSGLNSFLAAFVVICIFMGIYYAKSGLVANVALIANLIFILGTSAAFTIVLTLPGIAAVVLTVGMAVDANVLIFERIREEIAKGKTLKASIRAGFSNAFSSVMDANITTFLTGVVLYAFGVGPIRGFAVSLMIGIVTSLISALIITRLILDYYSNKGGDSMNFGFPSTIGLFNKVKINMVQRRRTFYYVSAALVTASLLSIGVFNFKTGVDFKGGRQFQIEFTQNGDAAGLSGDDVNTVRRSLTDAFGGDAPIVKTVSSSNQLMVTSSYLVSDREATAKVENMMLDRLKTEFSGYNVKTISVSDVGPTVANDIRTAAYFSVIFSLLIIFFYILVRFRKWQYSAGAIVAVFHDVIITLGIFSILGTIANLPFNVEINQAFIAALLTIIGYSINDTVVVFDRIR